SSSHIATGMVPPTTLSHTMDPILMDILATRPRHSGYVAAKADATAIPTRVHTHTPRGEFSTATAAEVAVVDATVRVTAELASARAATARTHCRPSRASTTPATHVAASAKGMSNSPRASRV